MKDYDIKDRILRSATNDASSQAIAANFKTSHDRIYKLILDMSKDGYIEELSAEGPEKNYTIKRTQKGEHFIYNLGYRNGYKIAELSGTRKKFIEWATLVFSLLTACIAAWQGVLTNKMNKLEDENKKLHTQVDSLIKSTPKLDTTKGK